MTDTVYNKNGIPFDIDAIATDLNGKADCDLTNVNDTGTAKVANWAMPSAVYDDLALGASGTTYTAPANGWFCFYTIKSTAGYTLLGNTNGFKVEARSTINGAGCGCYLPARKGDVVVCDYDGVNSNLTWRFYYAEGTKGEA